MIINRMYHFTSMQKEKHYLRLLLTTVRDARSFNDLRIVNEVLHLIYRSACITLRLLKDNDK